LGSASYFEENEKAEKGSPTAWLEITNQCVTNIEMRDTI
jgi:hypothetical protein